ncbi:MAG: hypothetical protein E7160_00535 [Firmicutes bacterium]|nr:hypothetical protein [Bacillota bacterium]
MQTNISRLNEMILVGIHNIFKKYPHAFTEEEKNYIVKNYDWINRNNGYNYILREIYDELGIIPEEDNLYLGFIKLIEEKFGLNRHIVEIGGGIIPSLSKHIALRQESGMITVFDSRLAVTNSHLPNLKLIKEKFDKTKVSLEHDLLIGLHPYGGTKTIVEAACENNSDFIIALGDLPVEQNSFIEDEEYDIAQQHLIFDAKNMVRESGLGELEYASLEEYGSMYPVIYNKRRK